MPNAFDHTDFMEYNGDSDSMDKVCTASLVKGKVVFEGKAAERVEKMVRELDTLKPYLKRDGYFLLAQLPVAFHGTYAYFNEVEEATVL
jgi:hypothetical protein